MYSSISSLLILRLHVILVNICVFGQTLNEKIKSVFLSFGYVFDVLLPVYNSVLFSSFILCIFLWECLLLSEHWEHHVIHQSQWLFLVILMSSITVTGTSDLVPWTRARRRVVCGSTSSTPGADLCWSPVWRPSATTSPATPTPTSSSRGLARRGAGSTVSCLSPGIFLKLLGVFDIRKGRI